MQSIEIKELEKGWIFRCMKKSAKTFFLDPKMILFFFLMASINVLNGYFYLLTLGFSIFVISYSIVSKNKTNKNQIFSKHFFQTFKTFIITNKYLRNFTFICFFIISLSFFFSNFENNNTEQTENFNLLYHIALVFIISFILSFMIFKISLRSSLNNYISLKENIIFSPEIIKYESMFNSYFYDTLNPEINNKNGFFKFTLINSLLIFLFFIIGGLCYYKFFSGIELFDTTIFFASNFYSFTYICCLVEELIDGKPEKVKQEEFKPATNNV
tara:strand:+ start:8602 stop:9414 length:813 start_codon:yes stop_codon:yes gene_type:complete